MNSKIILILSEKSRTFSKISLFVLLLLSACSPAVAIPAPPASQNPDQGGNIVVLKRPDGATDQEIYPLI